MNYSIKPEEHELREAKQVVEGALANCQIFKEKESDFEIELNWDPEIHSSSRAEDLILVGFNTKDEDWKKRLEIATVYGYAHSLYYEIGDRPQFKWQEVLLNSFGLIFLDEILPEKAAEETSGVEEYEVEDWPEMREELSEEVGEGQPIPWQFSYLIGQRLREHHKTEKFPDLKRSQVLEAGDKTFD